MPRKEEQEMSMKENLVKIHSLDILKNSSSNKQHEIKEVRNLERNINNHVDGKQKDYKVNMNNDKIQHLKLL